MRSMRSRKVSESSHLMADERASTATRGSSALTAETVRKFRESLRGELIRPGDAAYDDARKVYNAMIDRRPALIARCVGVADVITAVNFARENNLLVAVRGGGHNAAGLGICE